MNSDDIIKGIDKFFETASDEEKKEVMDAFSVEIEGDITIEEYLNGFNEQYNLFKDED